MGNHFSILESYSLLSEQKSQKRTRPPDQFCMGGFSKHYRENVIFGDPIEQRTVIRCLVRLQEPEKEKLRCGKPMGGFIF